MGNYKFKLFSANLTYCRQLNLQWDLLAAPKASSGMPNVKLFMKLTVWRPNKLWLISVLCSKSSLPGFCINFDTNMWALWLARKNRYWVSEREKRSKMTGLKSFPSLSLIKFSGDTYLGHNYRRKYANSFKWVSQTSSAFCKPENPSNTFSPSFLHQLWLFTDCIVIVTLYQFRYKRETRH